MTCRFSIFSWSFRVHLPNRLFLCVVWPVFCRWLHHILGEQTRDTMAPIVYGRTLEVVWCSAKKLRNVNACIWNDKLKVAINWMINGGPIMGFFIFNDKGIVILIVKVLMLNKRRKKIYAVKSRIGTNYFTWCCWRCALHFVDGVKLEFAPKKVKQGL